MFRKINLLNAWHAQAAIDVSGLGDTTVDPAEVAGYHFKLGRILWETKAKGCAVTETVHISCTARTAQHSTPSQNTSLCF
jgi:hypothetical protein